MHPLVVVGLHHVISFRLDISESISSFIHSSIHHCDITVLLWAF